MNEDSQILINFRKLEPLLKSQGKTYKSLRDIGISPGIVQKLRHGGGHIDTRTIQKVCEFLHCQPGDIMEFMDENGDIPTLTVKQKTAVKEKKGGER